MRSARKGNLLRGLVPVLALVVVGGFAPRQASATTIVTNLGDSPNGNQSISGASAAAVGFTVNGGSDLDLTDAMFDLFDGVNSPGDPLNSSDLLVGIFADSGGHPTGTPLVTLSLTTSTITGGEADYTATPNSPFVLVNGTPYWLLLNDSNTDRLAWRTTGNGTPTTNGASFNGLQTGVMAAANQPSTDFAAVTGGNVLFAIDADQPTIPTGTPEPGTVLLLVAGFAGIALRTRLTRASR